MNSSVAYWFGALPFNLGIVGSSPDSAERQFIFIFLVDLPYCYFYTWSAKLKKLLRSSFFNVADKSIKGL